MDIEKLVAWFSQERQPSMPKSRSVEYYYQSHPRVVFLKTLRKHARILDAGAGEGSLQVFRGWLDPVRTDLEMYAYSLEKGTNFDAYDGYELGNWEKGPPKFPGIQFDAVVAAHFIEHVSSAKKFIDWIAQTLRPAGRVYIEWPSLHSLELPAKAELAERGVEVMIANFHDDKTHQHLPERNEIVAKLESSGFMIDQQGVIKSPFFEEELLAQCIGDDDAVMKLAAFWSKTRWAQFVIASRADF